MKTFDAFVLRTPLLPFAAFAEEGLHELFARPDVREALRLATPSLEAELDAWLAGKLAPDRTRKVERALYAYLARMTARPAPFGLFAGITPGTIGGETRFVVQSSEPKSRADFARSIEAARAERGPETKVRRSSTLYRAGGQIRFLDLSDRTVMLELSPHLEATLSRASETATIRELAVALVAADPGVTEEDALDFVGELLELGALEHAAEPAITGVSTPGDRHVDLLRLGAVSLGKNVIAELARGVELLRRWSATRVDRLGEFRRAFVERYGDRRVPIAEVFDEDDGLPFPAENPARTEQWERRHTMLLGRLGDRELSISEADLRDEDPPPLPSSFSVRASIAARSPSACTSGDFRVRLISAGGPSGANLLARFCHLDPRIDALVRSVIVAEEQTRPDAVFAEIVHLPDPPTGNVLVRPVLRGREIVYRGRSGAPPDAQLTIDELFVSVERDRIVLGSDRHGAEIVPRLSTAHDYDRGPPIYRFLCALQEQGTSGGLRFSWGPLAHAPRLPRVVSGRLVLSPARWRLPATELATARDLPRFVELVDRGGSLLLDLENPRSLEVIKGRRELELAEMFPPPDQLLAEGPDGPLVHDLIVPFSAESPVVPVHRPKDRPKIRRTFAPGSEWLYAKLYCGPAALEHVLRKLVRPLLAETRIASWFFLRYADPEYHLRLRLRGEQAAVLARFQAMIDSGRVRKIVLDTYERELERYGDIEVAEQIFDADSEAALAIIERYRNPDERLRATVLGADALLESFGLDLSQRLAVCVELRGDARTETRIYEDTDAIEDAKVIIQRRSARIAPLAAKLDPRLAPDFLHLLANRWLTKPEGELMDVLVHLYRARRARQRASDATR